MTIVSMILFLVFFVVCLVVQHKSARDPEKQQKMRDIAIVRKQIVRKVRDSSQQPPILAQSYDSTPPGVT